MVNLIQRPTTSKPTQHGTFTRKVLSLLLVVFVSIVGILASVPPVSRDALTHHLYIPKLYLQHGGIYEIPSILYSYFPMNLDMLYMLPLAWGNDIAPKYIHFAFALFTAIFILIYLSKKITLTYGLLGALFFLSTPVILKLSITAYVDLGLVFFSTASLLLLLKWLNDTSKCWPFIISAICCGLALGTKYNGLITFLLLTLFLPVLYNRAQPTRTGKRSEFTGIMYTVLFSLIALLVFSPWALRNYLWTENPLYPLFSNSGAAVMGGMNQFVLRKFIYHETWWQSLLIPLRIFFEGRDNSPQFFDGQLNPFLLILPILSFIPFSTREKATRRETITLLLFSILFLLFAFFKRELRIRYIGPIIPALVILSMFGLQNLTNYAKQQKKTYLRRIFLLMVSCLTIFMFSTNLNYLVKQIRLVKPLGYLSGNVSRAQYISRFRPEYPAIDFINKNVAITSKLLCIFLGNRGYYFNRIHSFDLQNRTSTLCSIVRSAATSAEVEKKLHKLGYSHLLIREDLWQQWTRTRLTQKQYNILVTFMKNNTIKLYHENGYGVYQLTGTSPKNKQRETHDLTYE